MGNIFINGQPVCDDYADQNNNAALVVCRYTQGGLDVDILNLWRIVDVQVIE